MSARICVIAGVFLLAVLAFESAAHAQSGSPVPQTPPAQKGPESIERIGPDTFRIGQIRIDTARHEVSVTGSVNRNVSVLEFLANKTKGMKAYETALTLDTDAVTFNAALVLIGLDKAHAKLPSRKFDTVAPEGDPVEVWVECPGGQCERMRAERLLLDRQTKMPLPDGTWVYTGSMFASDGRYRAELEGVLIGLYSDPAPIIGFVPNSGIGRYGSIMPNPNIGLTGGTPITLTIKAINPGR